jgi:chromosome segregation protein
MHSVVSQGRVESIVTSKPRDRRLLIEEAAGLGKHRKRRRRAQLKLERTQDNLDRALDVEREARSRLRPLKRQAEAAELHERLERQTSEARWELARDTVRARRADLAAAEATATSARAAREEAQAALAEVAARRQEAEEALARRTEQREALARRVFAARSSAERVELRLDRTRETAATLAERVERRAAQLRTLHAQAEEDRPDEVGRERVQALEAELERLDAERADELELEALAASRDEAAARVTELAAVVEERRAELAAADQASEVARRARRAAETSAEAARREAAKIGGELASVNQFLRSHAGAPGGARSLADELEVQPGCELALAAALGGRLRSAMVEDVPSARALLDRMGTDGGRALVGGDGAPGACPATPPAPGAQRLADLVGGPDVAVAVATRLLADSWLVDDLDALPAGFSGIAVTRSGRAWFGHTRELRQAPQGGSERVLAERNRRDALVAKSEEAVRAERGALQAVEQAGGAVSAADTTRDGAERAMRAAERERSAAVEAERRASWLIDERRKAPEQGAAAIRRAELLGELGAEKRVAERAARDRAERAGRIAHLEATLARDRALHPVAEGLVATLARALGTVRTRVEALDAELAADSQAGEGVAAALRACASEEAQIQQRLRERGDAVTTAEVRAQQARDQETEASLELGALAERLGLEAEPASEALDAEAAEALRARIERLVRRREQLGPVNPLAKAEYDEAIVHVEELETQRTDLETALRELRGLIRDTDRQIRETFEETFTAAARNFEELAERLFPGGRGRLRLVREDAGPRPVLGGAEVAESEEEQAREPEGDEADGDGGEAGMDPADEMGVEIEITPAGKAMKRLTLLSGGEKSMTAIAFLFSVFLAKPCPFYILDEVEAALDDLNIGRFLDLLMAYADRAQFIVVTHQKRTMEAADTLYGVSMGDDGVSKVVSRRLPRDAAAAEAA